MRFADRIAYLSHDALDAVRAGLLAPGDLPDSVLRVLGPPGSRWVGRMVTAVLDASASADRVTMAPDVLAVMHELRAFLFERVYATARNKPQQRAAAGVIRRLVDHHLDHPGEIPATYRDSGADLVTQVADYVSGMTDRFALSRYERLFGDRPAAL